MVIKSVSCFLILLCTVHCVYSMEDIFQLDEEGDGKRVFPSKKDGKKRVLSNSSGKPIISSEFYNYNQLYLNHFTKEPKTFLKPVKQCTIVHLNKQAKQDCSDCFLYSIYQSYQLKRLETELLKNKTAEDVECKKLGKHTKADCIECDDIFKLLQRRKNEKK